MAAEGTGAVSSIRIKNQTAVDTIPTASLRSIPFAGVTYKHEVGNKQNSNMLGALAAIAARYYGPGKHSLDLKSELGFTTLDDLLSCIVGDPAVSGDGTTTAYTNTYTPAANPKYKYIQGVEGDIPTTKAQGYKNCLVTELTISVSADNPLGTITAKIVGNLNTAVPGTGETLVTTTLVTVTHVPLTQNMFTIWNLGVGSDTTYCVRSVTIKLVRPIKDDRTCIGRTFYKAPIFVGPLDASYEIEAEFDDAVVLAAFEAQTILTGFRLKAVGSAFTAPAGVTDEFYTLEIRSSKALIPSWELPTEDNGKIVQKFTVEGYGNSGSGLAYEAFACAITNNLDGASL